ncbi:anti-sigma factor [Candidatus Marithrix sp. Canyon 246]|uniref:anti-sigma factor n=1 Tax=Candidatus Marithrix sp. Canyon 246 TaxID=1827136 RepID=UPI00084A03D4|nr:anti-sigma factor [Candidatus Marithrix sp. Canyon 246]
MYWELYFYKFYENMIPVLPPKHIWSSIITKINPEKPKISLWDNILLWRSLATSFVIMSLFLMFIVLKPFYQAEETLISIIQDSEHKPIWLINVSLNEKNIIIKTLNKPQQITAKQDFELWLLPKEKVKANPISIGLLPKQGNIKLRLTEKLAHLSNKNKIAVSLEPLGGSPNELPSGEILYIAELL